MNSITKAVFDKAVVYKVEGTCISPLRTGNADGDMETVLFNHNGQAIIQGTSIAGALREWIGEKYSEKVSAKLFGKQNISGALIISDAIFSDKTKIEQRPRVKIDRNSGSTTFGGKFDISGISENSNFNFYITWLGYNNSSDELKYVEEAISALNSGTIQLGAQKSNGFGLVTCKAYKEEYDLMTEKGRNDWIEGKTKARPLKLDNILSDDFVMIKVVGSCDNILVKDSAPKMIGDKTVSCNIMSNGKYIIPGSAIKGAVRAQAEYICDVLGKKGLANKVFGCDSNNNDVEDRGIASTVMFYDSIISKPQTKIVTRTCINYFTANVMNGKLFSEEVICGDLELKIKIKKDGIACGLVLLALRDLALQMYNLGSGYSIGRGFIKIRKIIMEDSEKDCVLIKLDNERNIEVVDKNQINLWLRKLGGHKNEA